jgi:hypothetical protein
MGNEREPDAWLAAALRQTPATASDACLDAETLAAWADGGLDASAATAVELHASSCSRCTAVLAALERSAPAASATHVWTPARVFRWLAPLAAAATAVAIWIAVPDRSVIPVEPAPAHDLTAPAPETPNREPGTRAVEPGTSTGTLEPGTRSADRRTRSAEPGTANQQAAPSAENLEPEAKFAPSVRLDKPAAEEQFQMRDELRRETAALQGTGAAADAAAEAPPTAAAAPSAPPPATARSASPPTAAPPAALAETLTNSARTAFMSKVMASESVSPSNPLMRWRIVESASVERSTDGGKRWAQTSPLPGVAPNNTPAVTVVVIRAVDGDRAVARTSNGVEFYTTNGGRSWTRVQENSAAPF